MKNNPFGKVCMVIFVQVLLYVLLVFIAYNIYGTNTRLDRILGFLEDSVEYIDIK